MSEREGREAGAGAARGRGSSAYPEPVERLIAELSRLPGIGRRSAERLAFHVLKSPPERASALAGALTDVKAGVRHCPACFNLCGTAQSERCAVCEDPRRDRTLVLVVEQPKDLIAIEQTGSYRGLYHVLMGRLSPLDGVGPEDLTIDALAGRVGAGSEIEEVILGLSPTLEGDGTALYLRERLGEAGAAVSRLARGLPTGSELTFASKAVLIDAIAGRRRVE